VSVTASVSLTGVVCSLLRAQRKLRNRNSPKRKGALQAPFFYSNLLEYNLYWNYS